MTYTAEKLRLMDPALIAKASPVHIENVIKDLILTALGSDWVSVKDRLPKQGELVMVYVPGSKHQEADIRFDAIDPNDDDAASWYEHNEYYEHFCCIAKPPGSIGPSAEAPYTHWMHLPAKPEAK